MRIKLSDHFTYRRLLKFTLPSIVMMIFTSIYGVVDGFFVSNFAGKTAFASVNFIWPVLMILGAVGFMLGTGGSALVAKTLGEGDTSRAKGYFSMFIYVSAILGIVVTIAGLILIRPVAEALGAKGEMLESCILYGRIILIANPAFVLQMEFQSFFITAEKPQIGLAVTIAAGVTNMLLDALFVAVLQYGLAGAAWATAISQVVGGVIPLIYFMRKNSSLMQLTKTKFDGRAFLKGCINGSSELMSSLSASLVGMLYNMQLLKYAGENGVAAYGVLMYVSMVFNALFIGYSIGTAPVIGYNYGAANHKELKGLLKKSLCIIAAFSIVMLVLSEALALPLSNIFVGYDKSLLALTSRGFLIYSFSFLFTGFAIFSSGFFTALNDGLTSALISFLRTLVFQIAAVMLLPLFFEVDGIWMSIVVAEIMAAAVGIFFIIIKRKKFRY